MTVPSLTTTSNVGSRKQSPWLLLGGGRWSRVLLPVLRSVLPSNCPINWVTQNNQATANSWLLSHPTPDITVMPELEQHAYQAAVVATSPATHASWLDLLLRRSIPTFCEKPLTLTIQQSHAAVQLAEAHRVPLGVNLELHYASYLERFAEQLDARPCDNLDIDWLDPWTELRYGELKHGDIYTEMVHDMWPHCWSLLRRLLPQEPVVQIDCVTYDPLQGITIVGKHTRCRSTVRLTRRHAERRRCIRFNGQEATLDFSQEPGISQIDGIRCVNQWQGERPLARALREFVAAVHGDLQVARWPLAAQNCLDSVRWSHAIADQIQSQQAAIIEAQREVGFDLRHAAHRNLLIDTYLPRYAQRGIRLRAFTEIEQSDALRTIAEAEHLHVI